MSTKPQLSTLASIWDTYNALVLPHDAPRIQRLETKRAFYAGAQSTIMTMLEMVKSGMNEDAAAAHIEVLWQETLDFAEKVKRGEA